MSSNVKPWVSAYLRHFDVTKIAIVLCLLVPSGMSTGGRHLRQHLAITGSQANREHLRTRHRQRSSQQGEELLDSPLPDIAPGLATTVY